MADGTLEQLRNMIRDFDMNTRWTHTPLYAKDILPLLRLLVACLEDAEQRGEGTCALRFLGNQETSHG